MKNKKIFSNLLSSQVTAAIGESFLLIALATQAVKITGSGLAVAWILSINVVATFTIGLLAGWIIDRVSKKQVMLFADIFRAVLIIPFFLLGKDNFWIAYILVFLIACLNSMFHPARESYIQRLFTGDERFEVITSVQSALSLINIIGPAFAGLLIAIFSENLAFTLNILTFLISASFVLRIPKDRTIIHRDKKDSKSSFKNDVFSGWIYIYKNRILLKLNISRIFYTISLGIFTVVSYPLLVDYSKEIALSFSFVTFPILLGIVDTFQGIGSFSAGMLLRKNKSKITNKFILLSISGCILAAGYSMWMFSNVFIVIFGSLLIGFSLVVGRTAIIFLGQENTDPEIMARAITAGDAVSRFSNILAMGVASLLIVAINMKILLSFSILASILIIVMNLQRKKMNEIERIENVN